MDALHHVEEELVKKQEALKEKEQRFEAQRRLEHLKTEQTNWQIDFAEVELQEQIGEGGFGKALSFV